MDKDNGLREENGAVVKRATLISIYREVQEVKDKQDDLCKKIDNLKPKVSSAVDLEEKLNSHIEFCEQHRSGIMADETVKSAYERGRSDVEKAAEKEAEKKFKKAMYFWAKIIIPAAAILFGMVYYFLDRIFGF